MTDKDSIEKIEQKRRYDEANTESEKEKQRQLQEILRQIEKQKKE